MEYVLPSLVIAAAIVIAGFIVRAAMQRGKPGAPGDEYLALLQNQVNANLQQTTQQVESMRRALSESMQSLSGQVSRVMIESSKTVGERLDNTTKIIGDVRQQLGQLEKSSTRMVELGQDISRLEELLQPPKLRGGLGELFLADLLSQILPSDHYRLQYRFAGGETVDAVVMLRTGIVPIDAKFPLESFRRILAAETEDDRRAARKAFLKDIRGHIDSIASKYIRPDEKTFDFALMYVPAENVYYETIIKDDALGGEMALFSYALQKRVIPVSPNSFYAYLQTIILGLKGMRVEEHSREILQSLSRLRKEFETFGEAFRLVGQHLDNSVKKFADAQRRFGKVEAKVEQVDGMAKGLEAGQEVPAGDLAETEEPARIDAGSAGT